MTLCALAVLCALTACGSDWNVPDPVDNGTEKTGGEDNGDNDDPGGGTEDDGDNGNGGSGGTPDDGKQGARGLLAADGNDEGTYALILSSGYNYETPDTSGAHALAPFRHIRQTYDETLGKHVFEFWMHIDNDDDRGLANVTDRQRNEIKTDAKSPADMRALQGETLRMTWKFRLPEGMQTTKRFSHVHQLKGIDNKAGTADVGNPVITFTCVTSGSSQQLQVRYVAPTAAGSGITYLARIPLSECLGEWLSVSETVKFDTEGSYSLAIVRMRDGKQIASVSRTGLDLWRDGASGMRPKWGLYRNFGEGRSLAGQLRDEVLRFADFRVEKLQ